jgi:acetyl esterase/lipase
MSSVSIAVSAARVPALIACCVLSATLAAAQEFSALPAVPLYEGGTAPGAEKPRYPESVVKAPMGRIVSNVSLPDYTPYLPAKSANTRTAVIIAPGGAFRILAVDHEGHDLARFLAKRGIAAFVLKYRVMQTDPKAPPPGPPPQRAGGAPSGPPPDMMKASALGVADGERAIAMLRARAGEYAIDPNRIVFVGFSAGAHIAAYMGLNANPAARANYVAPIYGAPFVDQQPAIPADMPPVFLAWAQDDQLVGRYVRGFYDALLAAGKHPEAHFYVNGGHGFGMTTTGKSSDAWPEAFFNWLRVNGLTGVAGTR